MLLTYSAQLTLIRGMDRQLEITLYSEISGIVHGETTPNLGEICFPEPFEKRNSRKKEIAFCFRNKKWKELIDE